MSVDIGQHVEQKSNSMKTNCKKSIIILPGKNIDYNSKEFIEGLEITKQEKGKTFEYQNITRDKMYDNFNI